MGHESNPILIVGASTRAAAYSALRAGCRPICCDRFADADLGAIARVLPCEDYPHGLPQSCRDAAACTWMYTGALENHPAIVDQLSTQRTLWGCGASTLERVRNPWKLAAALERLDLPHLRVLPAGRLPVPDGNWMLKPVNSGGGRAICVWRESPGPRPGLEEPHYFQERRQGVPISGVYLALPGQTWLLGQTRQLVGEADVAAPEFAWCGTIAPCTAANDQLLEQLGDRLAMEFGLRGLFGIDFIVDETGAWPTELNPRYTAAVEIVEHLLQAPVFDWNRRACHLFSEPDRGELTRLAGEIAVAQSQRRQTALGKLVLYADCDLITGDLSQFLPKAAIPGFPECTDLPRQGQRISRGEPVCTVFAATADEPSCRLELLCRAACVRRQYFGPAAC